MKPVLSNKALCATRPCRTRKISDSFGFKPVLVETLTVIIALNLYLVAHFIEPAAHASSDALLKGRWVYFANALVSELPRSSSAYGFLLQIIVVAVFDTRCVQEVCRENRQLSVVVTLIDDLIHRIANPVG